MNRSNTKSRFAGWYLILIMPINPCGKCRAYLHFGWPLVDVGSQNIPGWLGKNRIDLSLSSMHNTGILGHQCLPVFCASNSTKKIEIKNM